MPRRHASLSPMVLSALLLAGCASVLASQARDGYLQKELGGLVYARTCAALWPDVLRQIASGGFSLVGQDRAVAGEPPQNSVDNFFSEGFQTRETYQGGLVVASDWSRSWQRIRANGAVVDGGCRVTFERESQPDTDDPGKTTTTMDLDMALGLLRRVDPAAAARVEAGIPRS